MKIQSIKLHGFKSFGEKTTINFDSSLIGIVGPNGSGKSNVIDAIKWVFGEQKAKSLRTTSNTDVIFVGSENKKAMNFAEVTLTFDNSDNYLDIGYSEVSITRRLFRNGDNEYLINGEKCRLKDISRLVMDKGFGKDSFSIISQGKIEEIIMAKPEKRREVVEEVAGVLKYKNQKDTATRKIARLDENLTKIEFIVNELDKKIEPLKLASSKAKRYKVLREELESKDINVLVKEIKDSKDHLDSYKINEIEYQNQLATINLRIKDLEKEFNELNININELQGRENDYGNQILVKENSIINLKSKINLVSERNMVYKDQEQQSRLMFLGEKITSVKNGISDARTRLSSLSPREMSITREISEKRIALQTRKDVYFSEKRELDNLIEERDRNDFPFSVRKIMDANFDGVIGTAMQLYTTKSGYEIAIDIAMGARKNEIVVTGDDVAKKAIEHLKQNKFGRATFSPLNKIKSRFIMREDLELIRRDDLFLGIAKDFVVFEDKYSKLFDMHLGNIVICENIDKAYQALRVLKGNYQIVTLAGDVVSNSGKLTGGFNRQTNKHQIIKKINNLNSSIEEYENSADKLNRDYDELITEQNEIRIELNITRSFIETNEEELKLYTSEYNEMSGNVSQGDQNNYEEELLKVETDQLKLKEKKEMFSLELKELFERRESINDNLNTLRGQEKEISTSLSEEKVLVVKLENIMSQNLDKLREEYSMSYNAALEMSNNNFDLIEFKKRVKEIKSEIKLLGFVNLDSIEEYEKEKERLEFYTGQSSDLIASRDKVLQVIEKLDTFVEKQFGDAFEKLNKEFKLVFASLFNGGNAELILTNPDNLLETGVEIIAQPPGKKSQIIGLLSGGEKALTAISLLFAILKVRTVPFAILDEVEAALDEVNVYRYASYLQVFSEKTQFIIITHRQGTMEKVDRLYGVTMPEKGISSVFDIDLNDGGIDV